MSIQLTCDLCDKNLYKELRTKRVNYFYGIEKIDVNSSVLRIVPVNGDPCVNIPVIHCPECGKVITFEQPSDYKEMLEREG